MNRLVLASFLRFLLVGGSVTGATYVAFSGLMHLGIHYLPAATAVWAFGVALNYGLSRSFTFARKDKARPREFATFVAGNLFQLGLGLTLYWVLIGVLGTSPTLAFVCNGALTAACSFAFMRWVVFPLAPRTRSS
ncbi:MAG TPA: GtrA family protein [Caulobacteraceae bacterium]|jgi:putative flippase GtrA|nr:GtrA family protein [Caulobacteraceae bacterium]